MGTALVYTTDRLTTTKVKVTERPLTRSEAFRSNLPWSVGHPLAALFLMGALLFLPLVAGLTDPTVSLFFKIAMVVAAISMAFLMVVGPLIAYTTSPPLAEDVDRANRELARKFLP